MNAVNHPLMAPYAAEAKSKPFIVSFGHRPRSASRMFHAATMRMKLRHQEVAKHTGKSGFGLPVAVLAKVLRAPKILSEEEQLEELDREYRLRKEIEESSASVDTNSNGDYGDLFFTDKEEADVFGRTGGIKSRSSSVGGIPGKLLFVLLLLLLLLYRVFQAIFGFTSTASMVLSRTSLHD